MSAKKDMDKVLKSARKRGCRISMSRKSHWIIRLPNGAIVVASSTPSCPWAAKHVAKDLKRAGLS